MREKYVYIGLIFAILGIVFFVYGIYLIQSVEAYDAINIPLSKFPMTISDDAIATYQLGQIGEILGGFLFIIGLCSLIVEGFILDKRTILKSSPVSLKTNDAKGAVARVYYTAEKKPSKQKKKKNLTKKDSPKEHEDAGDLTGSEL
jgi:uncharacterized membrane protein